MNTSIIALLPFLPLLLLAIVSPIALAADDQLGCGVFLPLGVAPPSSGDAAANASIVNSMCSYWQCSRAAHTTVPVVDATGAVFNAERRVCVRGLPENAPCVVDSDCYRELACRNKTVTSNSSSSNKSASTIKVCVPQKESKSATVRGYIAVVLCVLLWGSNFIPARATKPANGILFQFIMCSAIALVGFFVQFIHSGARDGGFVFVPYAMLGGMLWCAGNTLAVPVINLLGVGLSVSAWGAMNCIVGTLSAVGGVWGLRKSNISDAPMFYSGFTLAVLSLLLLGMVRPTRFDAENGGDSDIGGADGDAVDNDAGGVASGAPENRKNKIDRGTGSPNPSGSLMANADENEDESQQQPPPPAVGTVSVSRFDERAPLLLNDQKADDEQPQQQQDEEEFEFPIIALVGGVRRARVLGFVGACAAGTLFGFNALPIQRFAERYSTASRTHIVKFGPNDIDYVFSHFTGASFFSLIMLMLSGLYERIQRTRPTSFVGRIPNLFGERDSVEEMTWPAFVCGAGWALAQGASLFANSELSQAHAYPMTTIGPSIVASLWSLLYFRELSGTKNLIFLILSFCAAGGSAGCIVSSKNS